MMTMDQFQEEKARLVDLYGGTARDATGKRAQAFARLYDKSGWTQQALAECEKMSQSRVSYLLTFGKFLNITNCDNTATLTEGRFRSLWQRTDMASTQTERFAAVEQLLQEETTNKPGMKGLGKQLVAQFSDGKFHRLSDIANALDAEIATVRSICDRIVSKGTFQTFGERRPAPPKDGSYAYRFVKGGKKKIDLTAFSSEVQPVLDDMQMIINGPRKTDFSRQAMQTAFAQLLKVLDSVAR